jgi:hypothetical protein
MSQLLQNIKSNLLYIFMFIFLIGAIVYQFFNKTEEHTGEDNKPKNTTTLYVKIIGGSIVLICFLIFVIKSTKDFQNTEEVPEKSPVAHISKDEYKRQADEVTKRELEKLKQSEQYKKFVESKSGNGAQNWQETEKDKKVVYRDGPESDDSDEDLSHI